MDARTSGTTLAKFFGGGIFWKVAAIAIIVLLGVIALRVTAPAPQDTSSVIPDPIESTQPEQTPNERVPGEVKDGAISAYYEEGFDTIWKPLDGPGSLEMYWDVKEEGTAWLVGNFGDYETGESGHGKIGVYVYPDNSFGFKYYIPSDEE
jgi:hypothetical protein